jgi:hypothetical protein
VPGADEIHLGVGELLGDPGLVRADHVLDLVHDEALAGRPALVQAHVGIGVELALPVEHADVVRAVADDAPVTVGEFGRFGDEDFGHDSLLSLQTRGGGQPECPGEGLVATRGLARWAMRPTRD